MYFQEIKNGIYSIGARDKDRKLFDALIPLPQGTSYNAYLVKGSEKTALIDTVDPSKQDVLLENLGNVENLDYIISHHSEQDHSGSIPAVLKRYPKAKVITNQRGKEFLQDLLGISEGSIEVIADGDELSLGDKTLKFIFTPWVHWPETFVTHLPEENILFSCDFFGSHVGTDNLYAKDDPNIVSSAKRYFAEIMMPFRTMIKANLEKVKTINPDIIAPSHGPIYDDPTVIVKLYDEWVNGKTKKSVVIPYISMHGSTKTAVDYISKKLKEHGVEVKMFNVSETDLGDLAISLVDTSVIIFGTPTVLGGPHPYILFTAGLISALKPKAGHWGLVGSFGWGGRTEEIVKGLMQTSGMTMIDSVLVKGAPKANDLESLDKLVEEIHSLIK